MQIIGWNNFMDDSSQTAHMNLNAIDKLVGVEERTGEDKAQEQKRTTKKK